MSDERLRADDPDAAKRWRITDTTGGDNDFTASVVALCHDHDPIAGVWEGGPAADRVLEVPLTTLGAGSHSNLWLVVPGGNDVHLGAVYLH